MGVAQVLKDAWQAVEDSGVPEPMQEAAFNRALDLLGGAPAAQAPITPPAHTPPGGAAGSGGGTPGGSSLSPPGGTDENAFYTKMETATKVPRARLETLVHLDEGVPKMAIHTSALPKGKKPGALFISRVILTARYVWLAESEVALSEVRSEADRFGKYDGNFARHMQSLNGTGITISGSGQRQKAKVRQSYVDGFAQFLGDPENAAAS
jgi:hypothetical protein